MPAAAAKAAQERARRRAQEQQRVARERLQRWVHDISAERRAAARLRELFDSELAEALAAACPGAPQPVAVLRASQQSPQPVPPEQLWRLCAVAALLHRAPLRPCRRCSWGALDAARSDGLAALLGGALRRADSTPLVTCARHDGLALACWTRTLRELLGLLLDRADEICGLRDAEGAGAAYAASRPQISTLFRLFAELCDAGTKPLPKAWQVAAAAAGKESASRVLLVFPQVVPQLRPRLAEAAAAVLAAPAPRPPPAQSPIDAFSAARLASAIAASVEDLLPTLRCCPCIAEDWGPQVVKLLALPQLWRRLCAGAPDVRQDPASAEAAEGNVWAVCNAARLVADALAAPGGEELAAGAGRLVGALGRLLPPRSALNCITADEPRLLDLLRGLHKRDPVALGMPAWAQGAAGAPFFNEVRLPYDPAPEGRGALLARRFVRLSDGRCFSIEQSAGGVLCEVWEHGPRVVLRRVDELPGGVVSYQTECGSCRRWSCPTSEGTSEGHGTEGGEWQFTLWREKRARRRDAAARRTGRERKEAAERAAAERRAKEEAAQRRAAELAAQAALRAAATELGAAEAAAREQAEAAAAAAWGELQGSSAFAESRAAIGAHLAARAAALEATLALERAEEAEADGRHAVELQQREAWAQLRASPLAHRLAAAAAVAVSAEATPPPPRPSFQIGEEVTFSATAPRRGVLLSAASGRVASVQPGSALEYEVEVPAGRGWYAASDLRHVAPVAAAAPRHVVVIEGVPRSAGQGTNQGLRQHVQQRLLTVRGEVLRASLIVEHRRRTGIAAAELDSPEAAAAAVRSVDGTTVFGRRVSCRLAAPEDFQPGGALPPGWWLAPVASHAGGGVAAAAGGTAAGPRARRIAVVNGARCRADKCGLECQRVCPVAAVVAAGEKRAVINESTCIGCGACQHKGGAGSGCPFDAIRITNLPSALDPDFVSHRYGVNGFALYRLPETQPGRVLGIVGPNGVGKSTALHILAGATHPNLGRASQPPDVRSVLERWRGSTLHGLLSAVLTERGVASAKPQRTEGLRLELGSSIVGDLLRGADRTGRLGTVARELDLVPLFPRELGTLSGGELQRVCVALCCLRRAAVYLFDEPSSHLDIRQRLCVARTIRSLAGHDRSAGASRPYVVVVEHDLAILDFVSDRVAVLYGEPGCYGVAARPQAARVGVNAFLEGYIAADNVRFRQQPLSFHIHDDPDRGGDAPSGPVYDYGAMTKTFGGGGGFRLAVEGGQLQGGAVTVLLGENGTGKSTLVRLFAGLEAPDGTAGPLRQLRVEHKAQDPHLPPLPPGSTAADALQEGLPPGRLDDPLWRTNVHGPLRLGEIEGLAADSLSGGECQRVAIARCLAADADLYLLDEPSAHLDAEQRVAAALCLRRFARHTQRAVVVVEHDLVMALSLADSVVVHEGLPAQSCSARAPAEPVAGLGSFLRQLGVTVRVEPVTGRYRINTAGSRRDREQRERGDFLDRAAAALRPGDGTAAFAAGASSDEDGCD